MQLNGSRNTIVKTLSNINEFPEFYEIHQKFKYFSNFEKATFQNSSINCVLKL